MNWNTICSPIENGGLKIINLRHENNVYLLKFAWKFAYSNIPWSFLLKVRVLKSKYDFRMVYKSHLFDLELSSFILLYLIILLGLLVQVHVLLLISGMINGTL